MAITRVKTLSLTDGRFLTDDRLTSQRPLHDLGGMNISYRDQQGELFQYTTAELIASGYVNIPEFLTVDTVYLLRRIKPVSEL